jgi:hypothetical protein
MHFRSNISSPAAGFCTFRKRLSTSQERAFFIDLSKSHGLSSSQ